MERPARVDFLLVGAAHERSFGIEVIAFLQFVDPSFACGRLVSCSGFDRVSVDRFEFQLAHRAVASRYVVTHLTEILRLDELSIDSGVAVEISNFNYLSIAWKRVAFRYSDSTHETLALALHQIDSDGAVSIGGPGCGLGADDKRSGRDKLAFEVLSRPSSRIRRVQVLANEPFGPSIVHRFHEGAFRLRRHGRFTNAECLVHTSEHEAKTCVTDFVWLNP
jgi:hypothetical protein